MASEQDDVRARQLEALRRYAAGLGVRRGASDGRDRAALAGIRAAAAVIAALAAADRAPGRGGVGRWGLGRRGRLAGPEDRERRRLAAIQHSSTTTGALASAGCKTAVDRAKLMLASAVRLRVAVAEQGRILRDPANRRLSGSKVLQKLAPWLRASSGESARFNRALAEYRQVVDRCQLQAS